MRRMMGLIVLAVVGLAAGRGLAQAADDGNQLFAAVTTQRQDRFHHEVFEFTVAVYSRGLSLGREIALVNEETPGLKFRPFQDLGAQREEVEGSVYDVRRFLGRAEAIAAGTHTLRPTVRVSVVVPGRRSGAGARGDTPSPRAEIRQKELHPPPLPVRIRPLPEAGRPTAFAGAVGSFAFTASHRPSSVAAGEPVVVTLEIRGSGNIESLGAPQVSAGDQFKVYEPKLIRREIGEDGAGGRLVFEQTIVPRSTTSTSLPAVTFAYFDPGLQSYREVVRGPFTLQVRPSAQTSTPLAEAPAARPVAARSRIPAAIAPLKPEPRAWMRPAARSLMASPWLVALQLVPLAFVVVLFFTVRRRAELARDVPKARRQLAPSVGRTGVAAAGHALREGDVALFHESLWQALSTYFGHRLNLRPGEVTGAAVAGGLTDAGLGARDLQRLGEIFDLLERERFGRPPSEVAPIGAARQRALAELLADVERLLRACEEKAQ